jgi:branched-chain amino acid transport system substrate-binding protein
MHHVGVNEAAGRLPALVQKETRENGHVLKHLVFGLVMAATMPTAFETAQAADGLYVPLFAYRTGPFAGSGTPYANGLTDYLNMLNERDGGIGGIKLIIEECELRH